MSLIRVKRSGSSGSPSALAQGEMAYSFLGGTQSNGGDRLYIGTGTETGGVAANIEVIGGKYFTAMLDHVPGTLTANSAVIVDSNSKIDQLNVTALTANTLVLSASLTANGSTGSAGQVLTSNGTGTYWSTFVGSTDIGQTSNSSTISLTSSTGTGTTLAAANSTVAGLLSADAQTIAGTKTFTSAIAANITGTAASANNSTYLNGQAASYYNDWTNLTNKPNYIINVTGGTGVTVTGTASVGWTPTIAIGQDVATTANVTFRDIRSTGSVQIDGTLTVGGNTTIINATNLSITDNMIYLNNGVTTSISNAVANGTTIVYTANNNYSNSMVVTITGVNPSGYNLTAQTITAANSTTFTITNAASPGAYVSGGTAVAKSTIYPDIGFAGGYYDGSYAHAGLFRDATDGIWKFFQGYTPEPDASPFIDTANSSFTLSTVQANTFVGALSGTATSANTLAVARTINGTSFDGSANISITANTGQSLTFNNGGTGDASGTTFNGGTARTISYNTVGASPLAGSASLTTVGTITSGIWNGSVITGTYGGTGVNNGARTITIGGNVSTANSFTTSGNFALTLTTTAATSVTLPTTGTLISSADTGTVTSTMIADGTIVNGDISASAAIAVSKLAASTISGITLGNNLGTLTFGTGLTAGGSSYNGSTGVTITAVTANNTALGIASFDSTNFTVTAGAVAINTIDGGTY